MPSLIIRNYEPRDYPGIKANLQAAGRYTDGQDSQKWFDSLANGPFSAILIAEFLDLNRIEGSINLHHPSLPILGRSALHPDCQHPWLVTASLRNTVAGIYRNWGATCPVEELYDRGTDPQAWEKVGHKARYDLIGTDRPLWQPDGTRYPDLPLG